jgi:4-amino-4-deoxy-L-arabinose transferase-like glycosyltransferase
MRLSRLWQNTDLVILVVLALAKVVLHTLTNGQYGFHRDELAMVDDARYLAWGYIAYPPVTPFLARVASELFGPSLAGPRLFAALAQGAVMVLGGLMARELGGKRAAQIVAAIAVAISPVSLTASMLFQYVSFDYLWWVLIAYMMIRLLKSEDPRWWLGVGAGIGLGMMTKYTMVFLVAGLAGGVLLTPARRYLKSPWLWCGAALSLLILLPSLWWQVQHDFISLDFLRYIHARDVRIGRTDHFLIEQLLMPNPFAVPLCLAGLVYFFAVRDGKRYRTIGWMFAIPFVLFLVSKGRGYYTAPAYPMLVAAGAVLTGRWAASLSAVRARLVWGLTGAALALGGMIAAASVLPIAPVNSRWWMIFNQGNDDLKEQIGWPELVETVAGIHAALPSEERAHAGILAGNYGEAGAIDLYGPAHGLPRAISGINSYWLRGYGDPAPETLVVVGISREFLERNFESCQLAGHVTNPYGIKNEETTRHPDIYVCRKLRTPWAEFWKGFSYYG